MHPQELYVSGPLGSTLDDAIKCAPLAQCLSFEAFALTHAHAHEWMDGSADRRTDGQMFGRTDVEMAGADRRRDICLKKDGYINGLVGGQMVDELVNRWSSG